MADTLPLLLLVEDEPDLREAMAEYFDACGFSVQLAGTAAEALNVASKAPPQLVLSDLSLPDRRGDQFLAEFHSCHPECLLYVHSGDSTFTPSADLRAAGLAESHIFSKPANLSDIVAKLKHDLDLL